MLVITYRLYKTNPKEALVVFLNGIKRSENKFDCFDSEGHWEIEKDFIIKRTKPAPSNHPEVEKLKRSLSAVGYDPKAFFVAKNLRRHK